eukprot:SAG25_NODE_384_length_8785_cov_7.011628_10_plen_125_part_00
MVFLHSEPPEQFNHPTQSTQGSGCNPGTRSTQWIVLGASWDSAKRPILAFMLLCRFMLADRLAPEALRPLGASDKLLWQVGTGAPVTLTIPKGNYRMSDLEIAIAQESAVRLYLHACPLSLFLF